MIIHQFRTCYGRPYVGIFILLIVHSTGRYTQVRIYVMHTSCLINSPYAASLSPFNYPDVKYDIALSNCFLNCYRPLFEPPPANDIMPG